MKAQCFLSYYCVRANTILDKTLSKILIKICKIKKSLNFRTEREKLLTDVLAKGAAQLASAAQVRELRRAITLQTIDTNKQASQLDWTEKMINCTDRQYSKSDMKKLN